MRPGGGFTQVLGEWPGISLGLYSSTGILRAEAVPSQGGSVARSGRSAMFLFGVLWLAVLAAELTIAYQFLKAKIRHH